MARGRAGRDYEVGGRITLEDSFSAVAQRVNVAYGRLYALFRGGSAGMAKSVYALGGVFRFLSLALWGPMGMVAGIAALVRSSLSASATVENLEIAFTTLAGGNVRAAQAHIAELREFAIGKPFEFTQLAEQSRLLQTYGFAMRDVTGLLRDFGNAAFTANTGYLGVQRMTRVFGQMHATGKVTFGQLGMLVRAGVPAFQILRDELHLTDQQLRNIARSSIPADRIIEALRRGMQQRFAGGMDRAAQTITAKLSDLSDVAGNFLALVGGQMRPVFASFLTEFKDGIDGLDLPTASRYVAGFLSTVLRLVRIGLEPLIGAFGTLRRRWNGDTRGAIASFRNFLGTIAGTVEGAVALISGSQGNGMARVPRALRDNLVQRGLWPTAVAFVRWVSRLRAIISGFVEGLVQEFERFRGMAVNVARALGIDTLPLRRTDGDARALGLSLGHLVGTLIRLRVALLALETVLAVSGGVRGAAAWARGFDGAIGKLLVRVGAAQLARGAGGQFEAASAMRFAYAGVGRALLAVRAAATGAWSALTASPMLGPGGIPAATGYRFALFRVVTALRAARATSLEAAGGLRALGAAMLSNPLTWAAAALLVSALAARYLSRNWAELSARMRRSPLQAGLISGAANALGPISGITLAMLRARDALRDLQQRSAFVRGLVATVRTYVAFVFTMGYLVLALAVGIIVRAAGAVGRFFQRIGAGVIGFFQSLGNAMTREGQWVVGFARRYGMVLFRGLVPTFLWPYITRFWGGFQRLYTRIMTWIADHTRGTFSGLGESILSPFRELARELVRVYNGLPAPLRTRLMDGSIATLTAFGNGGGAQSPGNTPPNPLAGGGAAIAAIGTNISAAGAASKDFNQRAAQSSAPRTRRVLVDRPVVLTLNGQQIASAMATHEEEEDLRRGGPGGDRS